MTTQRHRSTRMEAILLPARERGGVTRHNANRIRKGTRNRSQIVTRIRVWVLNAPDSSACNRILIRGLNRPQSTMTKGGATGATTNPSEP